MEIKSLYQLLVAGLLLTQQQELTLGLPIIQLQAAPAGSKMPPEVLKELLWQM